MKKDSKPYLEFENEVLKKINEKKLLDVNEIRTLVSDFRVEEDFISEEFGFKAKTIIKLKNRYFLIYWRFLENDFEEREYEFEKQIPEEVFSISFYVNSKGKLLYNSRGVSI